MARTRLKQAATRPPHSAAFHLLSYSWYTCPEIYYASWCRGSSALSKDFHLHTACSSKGARAGAVLSRGEVEVRQQPHCSGCRLWRWSSSQHFRRNASRASELFLNKLEIHRWVLERGKAWVVVEICVHTAGPSLQTSPWGRSSSVFVWTPKKEKHHLIRSNMLWVGPEVLSFNVYEIWNSRCF